MKHTVEIDQTLGQFFEPLYVSDIKMFFDVLVTKSNGGLSTIIYGAATSNTRQLKCNWLCQHEHFHSHCTSEIREYHYC